MAISHRSDRSAIEVSGADAQKLLNNVLTADIKAGDEAAHWWALLSPQGKIQAEGLIAWQDDAFWLDVHRNVADAFLKRMRLYKLRAEVEIADRSESHAVGWSEADPSSGFVNQDPRLPELGFRVVAPKVEAGAWSDNNSFATRRVAAGIAELGPDYAPDSTFPHDVGMDLLSGVDFAKGCYVGQEVVSRMQHRGTARRRPVIVSRVAAAAGSPVVCADREAGTIGTPADGKAVAILRLDRVTGPEDATIDGQPVTLALPGWASYRFAESGGQPVG